MKCKTVKLLLLPVSLWCLSAIPFADAGETDITRRAQIDSINILLMESFPAQVHVHFSGTLGDSCTTVGQVSQKREGTTFFIEVTTKRPAEAICAQVLATFNKSVPLDVAGLKAGTYTVDINGVTDTFTLSIDNLLPGTQPMPPQ